jgi:lysophospholipase L1-like esterase
MKKRPLHEIASFRSFIALLLLAAPAFCQEAPAAWPMPSVLPSVPAGANSAAYPIPRVEWLERVKYTHDKTRPIASSIELVFDGDSITDGWQGSGREVWAEHYGKLNAFDFGISADRTEHVLWRLSQGQMDGIHPKLVALMIGTNNLGSNSTEQIAYGVKAIVTEYRKLCPEAVILVQAIFPRGPQAADPARAKIKAINEILSKLDDGKKVIYIDFSDKFLTPDGTLSPDIMPDFLHPNAKGYQIWAEAIQPVIDKYFPKN